jgi:acyl carrier protein phosphodiesterase
LRMNYLAHAFLSRNDKNLLLGNFIADHIRGNDFSAYPDEIISGINLHREIDAFTDTHPEFRRSKRLFYEGFEKHSGILVDIYFDHLLASNFSEYCGIPLEVFADRTYKVYTDYYAQLPLSSARFLDYVTKNKIYTSYANPEGIQKVLFDLSQRIKHGVRLDDSMKLFLNHKGLLENYFRIFFRDAVKTFL